MATEEEQAEAVEELVEEPVSDATEDVSKEETKTTEGVKPELKYSDEDFETAVQSAKDKELAPLQTEVGKLRTEVKTLKLAASEKQYAKDSELLYEEDKEANEQSAADKRREARTRLGETLKEYRDNAANVKEGAERLKAVDSLCEQLGCQDIADLGSQMGAIQRTQDATTFALDILLPKDKAFVSKLNGIIKRFEGAATPAEFKLIRQAIEAEGKGKPFVPASLSKDGTGGEGSFESLPLDERVDALFARGLKKKN